MTPAGAGAVPMTSDSEPSPITTPPAPAPHRPRPLIRIRNTFLTGLAVVIPLLATVFLLNAGLQIIDYVAEQTFRFLGLGRVMPKYEILGVRVIPLLILIAVVFIAGLVGAHAIGRRMFEFFDRLVLRVPLVSTIYSATKQVMETLHNFEGTPNFQYVVYVEYPAPGCRLIGFVTGHFKDPSTFRDITTVFLPTSPNPITGFVIAVESDKLMNCPLSIEEATKLIVSAGLVVPCGQTPAFLPAVAGSATAAS